MGNGPRGLGFSEQDETMVHGCLVLLVPVSSRWIHRIHSMMSLEEQILQAYLIDFMLDELSYIKCELDCLLEKS